MISASDLGLVPLAHPWELVLEALSGYSLAYLACAGMFVRRSFQVKKWQRLTEGRARIWSVPPPSFYWPVYVWGWEALWSVVYGPPMWGCGPAGAAGNLSRAVLGMGVIYSSVAACIIVTGLCAAAQGAFHRRVGLDDQPVAVPVPTLAVILNVLFVNSTFVLSFTLTAMRG